MEQFYLDSCIWLNLFKKEVSFEGIEYWKIAKEFIKSVLFSENKEIIYSGITLKELKFVLNNEELFNEKELFFKEEEGFKFVEFNEEDYEFARKLESETEYGLSFYDYLHIAICKRRNFVLVTRDNNLIKIAIKFISVEKPENLM